MKYFLFSIWVFTVISCGNNQPSGPQQPIPAPAKATPPDTGNFFPVTSYIKGQVYEIKEKGLTPLKYTTVNNHTDSAFIPMEKLTAEVAEFLQPEIDTANMKPLFTEDKFLDQTIAAFTFTCSPKAALPDSIELRSWNVYIDQETQKLKRVYMIKKKPGGVVLQLTWQGDEYCKMVYLKTEGKETKVIKEKKISWSY